MLKRSIVVRKPISVHFTQTSVSLFLKDKVVNVGNSRWTPFRIAPPDGFYIGELHDIVRLNSKHLIDSISEPPTTLPPTPTTPPSRHSEYEDSSEDSSEDFSLGLILAYALGGAIGLAVIISTTVVCCIKVFKSPTGSMTQIQPLHNNMHSQIQISPLSRSNK